MNCAHVTSVRCPHHRRHRYPLPVRPQSLFNTFLPLVKDLLNALLAGGFPLPSIDGLSLVGPQVKFNTGFMAIATNFTFADSIRHP